MITGDATECFFGGIPTATAISGQRNPGEIAPISVRSGFNVVSQPMRVRQLGDNPGTRGAQGSGCLQPVPPPM